MTIGELLVRFGLDATPLNAGFAEINNNLRSVNAAVQREFGGIQKAADNLKNVGATLTAAITLPIVGIGTAAVKSAADLQSLKLGLEAVTGSAAEADKQFVRLREVAKLPGLGLQEAVKGALNLQAIGYSAAEAERILKQFGNAIATVGGGRNELAGVITQLQQMGSKAKVTADDLKPLINNVPLIGKALKDLYGTVDSEQIQKLGIAPKKLIDDVLIYLEKLPRVTGGVKNDLENLRDTVTIALGDIGKAILPAVKNIVDFLVPAIEKATAAFTALSPELQNFLLISAGLAAAAGPALYALGALTTSLISLRTAWLGMAASSSGVATTLGGIATNFGSLAQMIPGVGVALAGVGIEYEAWKFRKSLSDIPQIQDAIQSLKNAIEELKDKTQTATAPAEKFFNSLTDSIPDLRGVTETLQLLWRVVNQSPFQTLSESISAVSGRSQELEGSLRKVVNALGPQAGDAAKYMSDLDEAARKTKAESDAATEASKKAMRAIQERFDRTNKAWDDAKKRYDEEIKFWEELPLKQLAASTQMTRSIVDLAQTTKKMLQIQKDEAQKVIPVAWQYTEIQEYVRQRSIDIDQVSRRMGNTLAMAYGMALPGIQAWKKALSTLGITDLNAQLEDQENALKLVAQATNNGATSYQVYRDALIRVYETKDKLRLLTDEEARAYENLKREAQSQTQQATTGANAQKKALQEVSTIINDMSRSIARSIIQWKGFGDVAKTTIQSIGEAILRNIIEHLLTTTKLIPTILKGLDSILSKIPGLGKIFGGIGGGGASIPGTGGGTSIPGVGGGSAGTGGIGSIVSSGIMGTIGAIGSIGSMVSGIIGNFQNARQETTLNAIEHEVRYSQIHLSYILEETNKYLNYLKSIHDRLFEIRIEGVMVQQNPGWGDFRVAMAGGGGMNGGQFNVSIGTYVGPGGMSQFVDLLVSELRKRGVKFG